MAYAVGRQVEIVGTCARASQTDVANACREILYVRLM